MELTAAGRGSACAARSGRVATWSGDFLAPLDEEVAATLVRALRVLAVDERVTE
ncbi:hypothetical protein [Streptomyces sp. NPDC050564]|uniref:hypothetical protein n=1 Tax=Streptomyces sp. NPDC050564 TaxID=3365631 RepID=UPI00378FD99C